MIEFSTNLAEVSTAMLKKLGSIDIDKLTRIQATSLMAAIRKRVHTDGIATDGRPIGKYSKSYLKYTRPKYGRTEGSKVVLSLTRTMENGMVLFPIERGTAIGYSTPELLQRALWQENRPSYGSRAIFQPTEQEKEMCVQIARDYIANNL